MDRQIIALREEVSLLQQNEKDYQDLNFLYINLEHRYNTLLDEKNRAENEFNRRNEFNLQTITAYRRDFELLQQQLDKEQIKYQQYEYILIENEQLLNEVNSLRDAYTKIVQQIQEQEETYQSQLQQKQQYIDNLCYQIKQLNDLKQHQEKKMMTDIEQKHQQHWKADKYVSEIESYKSENEKLNQYNRQQQLQVERLEKQIKNYQEQMNTLTNEMGKLQNQISSINKKQIQTGVNASELEMKNIKALNLQLMQKNENLTLSLDTLVQNNQLLIQECDQLRNQLEQIQSKKSDVQEQYVNSLNRMQEERRVIKDYLCIIYLNIRTSESLEGNQIERKYFGIESLLLIDIIDYKFKMAYQTFKPNMYVSERTTVKMEDHHNSRSTIQNQTQLIEILRGSLENKMDQEELWEIMEQVQGMSREQHIDLYALVSQLYHEMKRDNQLSQQLDALNSQIEIYVREITELKMEREEFNYKSRYTFNLFQRFKKNEQVQQLEDENQSLKRQLEITELERDSLQTAQSQLDKKVSRLSSHLRTEENEREELVREKQQLRQQLIKTQLQENQKLEAQLSLRQQELDFCQAKALQAEQQVQLYQTENLSLQKQIGTFKYQLEQQEIQYHQNISSIQSELQQLSDHYQNQTMALEDVQEQALNSERFISEVISQLQQITQVNSDDIFELLENIQANIQQKYQLKQQDDEKSQIIFDLQHKYSDKQTQNETLISQNQQLQLQLDTTVQDLKQLEKQRRIFKSEYSHLKQLLDQKVQECQISQERFKQLEYKMHCEIERSLKVEQEIAKLEEEKQQLCQNQIRQQSTTIHKKSSSTISDIVRQDYQALLQTFEKIKPLFTPTQSDLVDDMLQLQKILVKKDLNIDLKDILQQELKLQQMIHLHSLNQSQQKQQVNRLNQENRKLRLELSGTVSSSNRQTENSILKDRKYNQSFSIK